MVRARAVLAAQMILALWSVLGFLDYSWRFGCTENAFKLSPLASLLLFVWLVVELNVRKIRSKAVEANLRSSLDESCPCDSELVAGGDNFVYVGEAISPRIATQSQDKKAGHLPDAPGS
jgi:hypothetical protein